MSRFRGPRARISPTTSTAVFDTAISAADEQRSVGDGSGALLICPPDADLPLMSEFVEVEANHAVIEAQRRRRHRLTGERDGDTRTSQAVTSMRTQLREDETGAGPSACAGPTRHVGPRREGEGDHPRVREADFGNAASICSRNGPSPRARGRRRSAHPDAVGVWTIPACAGPTSTPRTSTAASTGPSPRARGRHLLSWDFNEASR